jgi:hypothetical protein
MKRAPAKNVRVLTAAAAAAAGGVPLPVIAGKSVYL